MRDNPVPYRDQKPPGWLQFRGKGFSKELVRQLAYSRQPPFKPDHVAQVLGVRLFRTSEWDRHVQAKADGDSAKIVFNGSIPFVDQRVAVACGLGHILLSPLGQGLDLPGNMPQEVREFALELLVPLIWLDRSRHVTVDAQELADIYRVPLMTMQIQMVRLWDRLWKKPAPRLV